MWKKPCEKDVFAQKPPPLPLWNLLQESVAEVGGEDTRGKREWERRGALSGKAMYSIQCVKGLEGLGHHLC